MKPIYILLLVCSLFGLRLNSCAQSQDNVELKAMYDEDQQLRLQGGSDWRMIVERDSLHRLRADQLLSEGKIQTAMDYYHAAMIFQHGSDSIDYGKAVSYMRKALELNPKMEPWLLAAAIDRDLLSRKKPQIYGTQFIPDPQQEGKWMLADWDTTQITDEERLKYHTGTIAEIRERCRLMNALQIDHYYKESGSIYKTHEKINSEFRKGKSAEYDVSENALNSFGYQLMAQNALDDALVILKLNTKLYPKGYNTYDSYGEALLLKGDKKAAKKAYKKSLKLNHANDNARIVLDKMKNEG